MQGNRGGRRPFLESDFPFPELVRPFPGFGGFGGSGGNRSLISSFLGGGNPFDDPFFTNPFGGITESRFFGSGGSPFMDIHPPPPMIENRAQAPERRGPVIQELNSNDDDESGDDKKEKLRKHERSRGEADVEDANDEARRGKYLHHRDDFRSMSPERRLQVQGQSISFHSATVSYGGANGTYYTSSRTRRIGSDGVVFEECKEADGSTMQATHRISRGLHNQGHSVTRRLDSDGKVDNIQTLHNLDEGSCGNHWSGTLRHEGGYALPATQQPASRQRAQLLQGQPSVSTFSGDH